MTWWISLQAAGMEQPGMMQPPSRRLIARRWVTLKRRSWEPMALMVPSGPISTCCCPPAQMNCSTDAIEIGASQPSMNPDPVPLARSVCRTETSTVGAAPP
ncbi:hypothetical protein ASC66_17370, partial [Leifsonia sp. Root4]